MLLSKVINNDITFVKKIEDNPDITGIDTDSRRIKHGMIFVAVAGVKEKGINFSDKAIEAGAKVILCHKQDSKKILKKKITILTAKDIKLSYIKISKKFFPKQPKNISAITGTNGKTSIAFYLNKIWKKANLNGASIGTLGIRFNNNNISTGLTTPDAISLIKNLDFLKSKKVNYVALEASSHGIKQQRIDALKINRGIFSNLSRDHLDYHKNMEDYFKAKRRLFSEILDKNGIAIINNSCKYGKRIEKLCQKKKIKFFTYGSKDSDWTINKIHHHRTHYVVSMVILGKKYIFKTKLQSSLQIENLVCAMMVARSYNLPIKKLLKWIENIKEPPGRLERINYKKLQSNIYIDYAHTPIALKKSLKELRENQSDTSKLKVLFGCGGNRDQGKRKLMGIYARQLADEIYITDDNPRYENAEKIRNQILKYCKGAIVVSDRKKAIFLAIKELKEFETLLVAGKGHEQYQEVKGKLYFFDDKKVVLEAINAKENLCL